MPARTKDGGGPCGPLMAGADGCRGGWVVALAAPDAAGRPPELFVVPDFAALLEATRDCRYVAIDMPAGLPTGGEPRQCDLLARRELARMARGTEVRNPGSRVFPPPPRGALDAASSGEFQRLHRELAGKGAPLQVWGIVPKLREVDRHMTPALQRRVFEAHPELAFARLAGGRTLLPKKRGPGREQRIEIIRGRNCPLSIETIRSGGVRAGRDDVLDALACLETARARAAGRGLCLPPAPPLDARGLRMEIWY